MHNKIHTNKDTLYISHKAPIPFQFNEKVSTVFDDMVHRSVPGYNIQQQFIAEFALQFLHKKGSVLDLGTSLGTSIVRISETAKTKGIDLSQHDAILCDNSQAMLKKCKEHTATITQQWNSLHIKHLDLNNEITLQSLLHDIKDTLQVVLLHFVLQFIPTNKRFRILRTIWDIIPQGTLLLLGEKLYSENTAIQTIWRRQHIDFKLSQGYSMQEIENKQQALQQVLIPTSSREMQKTLERLHPSYWNTYFSFGEFFCFSIIK